MENDRNSGNQFVESSDRTPDDDPGITPEIAELKKTAELERAARLAAEANAEGFLRELSRNQRGLELLQTITMAANQATTIEQAMQIAVDQISAHTGCPLGHGYLQSEDG